MEKRVRGIRGAIQVSEDAIDTVLGATRRLLEAMLGLNEVATDDAISAIFTTTSDLKSCFPAEAARSLGFSDTPLICAQEIDVPGSLPRVVRVLLWVHTAKSKSEIKHVYLDGAEVLRKDIAQ